MTTITAQTRTLFGKKFASLLAQGFVPAEIYGGGVENVHVQIPLREFTKVFAEAGHNAIVTIDVEGKKYPALISAVQGDRLGQGVVHVDFYQVRMDQKIKAQVPLHFVGESPAIKVGGVLVKAAEEIEVEALPQNLPHAIEVDLSRILEVHESIHVKDLVIAKDVRVLSDLDMVVATVTEQAQEIEETPAVVPTEGEASTAVTPEGAAQEPEKK
ncbi:MAG: 50S ribosomal protein L25 [Candidatus Paceibacterota bacterium]|jgi:large subunit ribosomal protein L25